MKDPSDDPSTKYNINYLGVFFFLTTVTFFREREREREIEGGGGGYNNQQYSELVHLSIIPIRVTSPISVKISVLD